MVVRFLLAAAMVVLLPKEPREVRLGESFDLRMGEAASVDEAEVTVAFQEVSSDSRCPRDVNCIRAGEAVVVLTLEKSDGKRASLELEVPPGGSSRPAAFDALEVTVVKLLPEKESTKTIDPSSYVATLQLAKPR